MNDCTLRSLPLSCVLSLLLSCTLITLLSSLLLQSSLTLSFYPLSPSKLSPTSPMFPLEALSLSAKVRTPSNPLFVSLSNLYTSLVCPFLIESFRSRHTPYLFQLLRLPFFHRVHRRTSMIGKWISPYIWTILLKCKSPNINQTFYFVLKSYTLLDRVP